MIALIKRLCRIATRAVPNKRGCHLRFINKNTPENNNLDEPAIEQIWRNFSPDKGERPIGTMLRKHVLEQLVYKVLDAGTPIKHPFLIICITDGNPTSEHNNRFHKEIKDCGRRLEEKGYKKEGKSTRLYHAHLGMVNTKQI
jgi:hypothetical protein